jgi:hypothetical protein
MKFTSLFLLTLFSVFLFTPTFVMLIDNNVELNVLINEIEEEEKVEDKLAEKEIEYLNTFIFDHLTTTMVYHEFLNKEIFKYIRHFIEEEVPPPEFV